MDLKNMYLDYLMDESNECFRGWDYCREIGSRKGANNWMSAWKKATREMHAVESMTNREVAEHITCGLNNLTPWITDFAMRAWGWMPAPVTLSPIFEL